ncbi:MAG TPA: transposase [Rhizomicrobium sp.]|nr:transposase [Rhizomicrobium sp.]
MARRKRFFLDGQPLHVIQRGNNRQAVFFAADDYAQYIAWLAEAAREYGLAVYAYVLMTNHVHLLAAPAGPDSLSRTVQSLGRRYVRYVNGCYGRTGTLWEGRYRAAPVDSDAYFFDCCRYIERNPVRARMVARARDWRWSSYRAHASGDADALLSEHPLYRALGRTAAQRQEEYRLRFRAPDDEEFVSALRQGTNGGWPVGGDRFKREIAKALKCRVTPLPPGPKPQTPPDKRQLRFL